MVSSSPPLSGFLIAFSRKAFQSRRKWHFNLGEKCPSTLRLLLVGSLDPTVEWYSFRDMLFTTTWTLHPPLGFIVRGSSRREPPWPKGRRRLLEWRFGLIQLLCQMDTPRQLPLTECDGSDHTKSSFTFE
ncbi:hypothetical protein GQ457_03G027920 [Hibiscus cannabinus]